MSFSQKAFTLLELLVVITIIGILSSIVIVSMSGSTDSANIAKGKAYAQQVHALLGSETVLDLNFNEGFYNTCSTGKDVCDASGYGNGGEIYNDEATFISSPIDGYALSFDGNNDYINIPNDLGDPSEMTIEFWFYVSESDKIRTQYLMDGRNGGNWWFLQSYSPSGTGNINFYSRVIVDPADWTAGKWNYLVLITKSTKSAIYINGELKATGTGLNPNIGQNMRIGTRYTNSSYFRGNFDEISIYASTLPETEIHKRYVQGLKRLLANQAIIQAEYDQRMEKFNQFLTSN